MAKQDFDKEDGVWRTVGGRRIFIRNGQSLSDAMKESGKFKTIKREDVVKGKLDVTKQDYDNPREYKGDTSDLEAKHKQTKELSSNSGQEKISNGIKVMRYGDDYIVLDKGANKGEFKTQKEAENFAKELDRKNYEEKNKNLKTDAEKAHKEGIDKNDFAMENAKHGVDANESAKAYDKATEKHMKEMNKEIEKKENERISKEKNEIVGEKKQNSQDDIDDGILERFGEDYGYDDDDNLKNLKGQIDYMKNPNESIHRTAERLVEGGDFLIYNEDIKIWLDAHNIKYNDDNFFDKYKEVMADRIEKLYNGKEKTTNNIMNDRLQQKAYQKYLKEHPNSEMKFEDFIKSKNK